MNKKFSLNNFLKKYPNDEACLMEIYRKRYPKGVNCMGCKRLTKYYPLKGRTTFSCGFCATQLSPLTDTIFEKSAVSLRLWFYAMFLMVKTRSGISAKQLERELGVSYKTAHRMFKMIRKLMDQDGSTLDGIVEIDETFVGGKGKNRAKQWRAEIKKEAVWGGVERRGNAILKHIPNTGKYTLIKQIKDNISPTAHVMSDELPAYKHLYEYGFYNHHSVNHSSGEYGKGLIHNNTIEGVWSQLKRGITGVYRHVSKEYLQDYVNEYAFRYNYRNLESSMFEVLLNRVLVVKPS
ncbi:MAG: ISSpo3, transposase [uncultured bacterium]|nr:MAG: ISSpo3, transposase [uncultured bacterium]